MADTSKPADGYGELVKAGDRAAAALDEVRSLIAERDELARHIGADPASVREFDAAQDKVAARAPVLVAALDRVLALAAKWEQSAAEMRTDARAGDMDSDEVTAMHLEARAAAIREAIAAGLGGEEADRG